MAQRPRLSQLKRNDVNFRTFKEQFETLENNSEHIRKPVRTRGELPFNGNIDGTKCLVIGEGVEYYWDAQIQNWQPILGQVFKTENVVYTRWKKTYRATAGQTDFLTDVLFEPGKHEVDVYIQGILQDVDIDYIEADNRTIRFLTPIPEGAFVTIASPMVVDSLVNVELLKERLEDLEYNNYQMMLNQYYEGKGFEAIGMVYDGFVNTSQIDYINTTGNVLYDAVRKSMYIRHETESGITEQFDDRSKTLAESTVLISNSEMTLPIEIAYAIAFSDDFATQDFMDLTESNVFWDRDKQLVTNDDTYGGGNHYYKGDFMGTTDNADLVGFSQTISSRTGSYYSHQSHYNYLNQYANCYAVLSMGNMNTIVNDLGMIYRNAWPYGSDGYMYKDGNSYNHRTDGNNSGTNYYNSYPIWLTYNNQWRPTLTYVRSWNKIVALLQYNESSGKYYQRMAQADGRTQSLWWSWINRPPGMPKTTFGSEVNTYTQSSQYISQIGSTYDHLLLRVGNVLYFLNSAFNVVKTLDWTKATRKPSTYNIVSQQITADKRYLYFPARLHRSGMWGYYLEVFSIEDGSFINEILVTRDNSGNPGTTAMSFDHDYNRLVLGQDGGNKYSLYGKGKNHNYENSSYAGFLAFEPPEAREREIISKPITTNLPVVSYRLRATHTLNSGIIDYYIRFNDEAWTKINPGTSYTWNNPNGASETIVQLRAVLQTTLNASLSPTLTAWYLDIKPFSQSAIYRSTKTLLSMDGVTGGSLRPTQDVPNETQISWYVQLDDNEEKFYAGNDGLFSIPLMTGDAYFTVDATLATNNKYMSPVVKDYRMQLYRNDEGTLVTETSQQLEDINEVNMWVTTSAGNSNYEVDVSRDGGITWHEAVRENSIQVTGGNIETKWYHSFKEVDPTAKLFKIRFRLNGATEILQYGAKIN